MNVTWNVRPTLVLGIALLFAFTYFFPRWADWNQNSRLDFVLAVVEEHSVAIDDYVANTGDYASVDGHYYSDKAPGVAILGIPVYAAYHMLVPPTLLGREVEFLQSDALIATAREPAATLGQSNLYRFGALAIITLFTTALPAAVLGVIFYWFGRQLGWGNRQSLIATLLYALGTSAFPYANTFVGHQTVAFFLFAAFALLFAIRQSKLPNVWLLACGFMLGYAVISEYQTVLICGLLALYAIFTLEGWWATILRLAVGAIAPLAILVVYDLVAFGTPLPVGYFHSTLWSDVHQTGLVSLTYPHLDALWGITFGTYRGLFFLSPYLLLALPGYVALWRNRRYRAEFWLLALAPLMYLLFNASSAMWQGGFSVGPRYLVPCLPFLAVAAGAGLGPAWRRLAIRPFVVAAIGWSVFAVWAESIAGQSFPDYTPDPLFNLSAPLLARGEIARNMGMLLHLTGWASLIPLAIALLGSMAVFLRLGSRPMDAEPVAPTKPRVLGWMTR